MDISKFKERFIEEAFDLVNKLEESLLDQEDNLENKENVQQIFRVLHTLKGTSAMYGYVHIGDLVHDLESIFDLIREDRQEFTTSIFEITLKIVDHIRNLLNDEKLENENNKKNQKDLLAEISKIVSEVLLEPSIIHTIPTQKSLNKETYYIVFHPTESQLFRCINILQIFNELAELGEYRIVNHLFYDQNAEDQKQTAWGIYLVTDQGKEAIEEVLMFVLDDCRILNISRKNLFNQQDFIDYLNSLKESKNEEETKSIQSKIEQSIKTYNKSIETTNMDIKTKKTSYNHLNNNDQTDENNNINDTFKDVEKQVTARINIEASKLDRLMYLVSELVITKSQLNMIVETKNYSKLISIAEKIDDLSRHFRDNALNIRLVPVAEMIVPFKRLIRDLSKDLGKEVKFTTKGIDTELDKNVIDRLAEPIMHIIRNSIDHGIESPDERKKNNKTPHGNITFTSFYSGANVYIQIQDDGAGIDIQKIQKKAIEKGLINEDDRLKEKDILDLLFNAGFSTAEKVTEVSGRGVGMDVVLKKITELRGEVEISTEKGQGTLITIKLHQTLSIIDTLLIKVDNSNYLVPISDIEYCEQEQHSTLYKNKNRQVQLGNELIPFVSLRDLFSHERNYPKKEKLIIINKNDKRIAIIADKIVGEHQAVLKPLGEVFKSQQFLSGASFLGDGSLALMLDSNKLVNKDFVKLN
ncbi:MAG: chemotaxis protein CheA [Marinilabiliaceae bacterium]|nr:chemotaxis protein CheA [Marinilabiliaceae bacterium]